MGEAYTHDTHVDCSTFQFSNILLGKLTSEDGLLCYQNSSKATILAFRANERGAIHVPF